MTHPSSWRFIETTRKRCRPTVFTFSESDWSWSTSDKISTVHPTLDITSCVPESCHLQSKIHNCELCIIWWKILELHYTCCFNWKKFPGLILVGVILRENIWGLLRQVFLLILNHQTNSIKVLQETHNTGRKYTKFLKSYKQKHSVNTESNRNAPSA